MPRVKEKSKEIKSKKGKGKKITAMVVIVLVVIAVVAAVFIQVTTKPCLDDDEKLVAVGGMVISNDIDYQDESAKGLEKNPIVKIMQMVWRFCAEGDAKKHSVQTPPDNIKEFTDLAYIDDGNRYHKLDVYYPENTLPDASLPVIIDIHGGGWMYGDKELNKYYCLELASRGYVVFNISYRLVPDVTVNEQIQDVAYALKYIRENMSNYPCDATNVMLTGDSAGGQLAIYSAVLCQDEELRKVFDVVDSGLDVTCLVLTSPVSYMRDGGAFSIYTKVLWGKDYKSKPTYDYMDLDKILINAQLPPTYLITSDGDTLAHAQTLKAAKLLEEKGVVVKIADYENLGGKKQPHVFSILNPFDEAGKTAIDGELEFYQATMIQ